MFILSYGQIILEKTFTEYSPIKVFNKNTTVYYYTLNKDTLKVLNQDYSIYKKISVNKFPEFQPIRVDFLGFDIFNTDNLLEYLCLYGSSTKSILKLLNEKGEVLKDFGDVYDYSTYKTSDGKIKFKTIESIQKWVVFDSIVYKDSIHYNAGYQNTYITKIYSINEKSQLMFKNFNSINTQSYPNPTKSEINLVYNLEKGENAEISIFDISGKLIESKPIDSMNNQITINVKRYNPGTYVYKYKNISQKFIVN
jgi:hypothetical protein